MPGPSHGNVADPALDPGAIDALIPPPWSTARRVVVMLAAVAIVAVVVLVIRSGLFGPQLEHVPSWGSSVEVTPDGTLVAERLAPIRNAGMLPVELQALELPAIPGLAWEGVVGLPASLAPGEQVEVTIRFRVTECTIDVGGLDTFPIRAESGIAPARVVDVRSTSSDEPEFRAITADPTDESTASVVAAWADQPPSWVLDTISAPCLLADDAGRSATGSAGR
jgi:hypothetical protein